MKIKKLEIDVKSFTKDDVDMEVVKKNAAVEAQKIYDKPSTRDGRSYDAIYKVALQSHIAERYLIEKHGFINDENNYMDVIYNGITIDVKTSTKNIIDNKKTLLEELAQRKTWAKHVAEYIIGFNVKNGKYTCKFFSKVPKVKAASAPITASVTEFDYKVVDKVKAIKVNYTVEGLYRTLVKRKGKNGAKRVMLNCYGIKVV